MLEELTSVWTDPIRRQVLLTITLPAVVLITAAAWWLWRMTGDPKVQ